MCRCARFGLNFAFNLTERRPLDSSARQVLVGMRRQRRFVMLRHTTVAIAHMLLRNYTGVLSRSVCADILTLCQDSVGTPLGLDLLQLLLETHRTAVGTVGLWRPAIAVLGQLAQEQSDCSQFCEVVVCVLRRTVRRANYFAVVQMFDCLPVVPKALQSMSSVLRTKALELVRIMALRVRDADRAAFVIALRNSRVCTAVMQRAHATALCPPCVREIKAVLAILGTITRFQIGSCASASRTGIDIALASWQHPRTNALLRVCLLEHMMCNFDALDATEHKVQVEDIVRTAQVRPKFSPGVKFH